MGGRVQQAKQASKMFVDLVVNDFTPGPGSVRDPPTSGGRGCNRAIARARIDGYVVPAIVTPPPAAAAYRAP